MIMTAQRKRDAYAPSPPGWRTNLQGGNEQVYLSEYTTGSEARAGISWWMDFYNQRRPHSSLGDLTPDEAYTPDESQNARESRLILSDVCRRSRLS